MKKGSRKHQIWSKNHIWCFMRVGVMPNAEWVRRLRVKFRNEESKVRGAPEGRDRENRR